jgi:hypothetical protein
MTRRSRSKRSVEDRLDELEDRAEREDTEFCGLFGGGDVAVPTDEQVETFIEASHKRLDGEALDADEAALLARVEQAGTGAGVGAGDGRGAP